MASATQKHRELLLKTPLGADKLLLTSFNGTEEMSRLFTFHLEMLSEEDWIAPDSIVGKQVTFSVEKADNKTRRFFNGFVNRFAAGDRETGFRKYRMEVVPWLWFLTQTSDCKIFQQKSIPDIIQEVFQEFGFSDFELQLNGQYDPWEYCVQYRESAFNFVSRLMEQEGIFYFFKHEEGKHTLVLGDHTGVYKKCEEDKVDYNFAEGSKDRDGLSSWQHGFEFTSGRWAQTDDNFDEHPPKGNRTPAKLLLKTEKSIVKLPGNDKYEVFDYPGEFETPGESAAYTKKRMEEEEAGYDVARGGSTCKTFTLGGKFTFEKHDCEYEVGKTYVITSIQHTAVEPADYGTSGASSQDYTNTFSCIPEKVIFRPARSTPKPVVQGIQTATVVGPDGEEIYTDKFGRIKVQFFWDRYGTRNENSSCWMRVGHFSAGKSWGALHIPRIGQEVIVTFLEGDPDWPLVTGTVYNSDQMPPYDLPAEKTKTYFKSNSSKDGKGYNELRIEDLAGKEQIFVHAQKDMDVRVLNDSKERIFGNRHQIIGWEKDGKKGGDQSEMVYQDKKLNIKRNQIEHIEGNFELMVGNGDADDPGKMSVVVEKQVMVKVGADGTSLEVEGDHKLKVGGGSSMNVGGDTNVKGSKNTAVEAGMNLHIKGGMNVVIEAGITLTLKVGGNFVSISPAGVAITGTTVLINSGGSAGSGAGCKPQNPDKPKEANPGTPKLADDHKTGSKSTPF